MAKSKTKRKSAPSSSQSKWASLPWKSVQVVKDTEELPTDVNDKAWTSNHYDNPKAKQSDLFSDNTKGIDYVEGANEPGIFLGLEVIDGSQYEVEKVPVKSGDSESETVGFVSRLVVKDALSEFIDNEKSSGKADTKPSLKAAKKPTEKKETPLPEPSPKPVEEKQLSRKEKNKLKLEKLKAKQKEVKLKKKRKREEAEAKQTVAAAGESNVSTTKKKKKAKNKPSTPDILEAVTEQEMTSIQVPWSIATGGVFLHPKLCKSLHRLNFSSPTPIQSSTLAASILGLRDVVGAAPTGSGKTLSYLLPILHQLLTEEDERNNEEETSEESFSYPLTALILCPTRELAMQVSMEFSKLVNNIDRDDKIPGRSLIQCGTIVGGLSEQKQKRVLDVKRPPVLVGTPGRLWDLVSSHTHFSSLVNEENPHN
jgi:ATP-dependent RNA helicase DDX24/MAK5